MRILIAPDKFKDSLGAQEVAQNIALGLREVLPNADIILLPVSDGGEGFAAALCRAGNGEWHECDAHDSLGRMVRARFCLLREGTAVFEMSEASGLWRLRPNERDPGRTSSFGTGEMLRAAARAGAKEIMIGLGGSATNDGGFGLARALGYRFLDNNGEELAGGVNELLRLCRIVKPDSLGIPTIIAACDVRNPLLGQEGATQVFSRQKGATTEQMLLLEKSLQHLADIVTEQLGVDFRDVPSSGAAGGLGFGLASFCGAQLRPGFQLVAEALYLEERVRAADLVITGEGKLDPQTLSGKAPAGVAELARRAGKPAYAIVGQATAEAKAMFRGVYEVMRSGLSEEECIARAPELLCERARELGQELLHTWRVVAT